MLAVALSAGAFRLDCILTGVSEFSRWFLLPGSLDAFAAGGLVAWMRGSGWGSIAHSKKWAWLLWIMALGSLAFSRYLRFLPDTHPGTAAVEWFECIFFCWLLLRLVEAPGSFTARALSIRPLRYVGKISYGIYVFHALIATMLAEWLSAAGLSASHLPFVRAVILSGISIAVAAASWRWIEQPLNGWMRRGHRPLEKGTESPALGFRAILQKGDGTA